MLRFHRFALSLGACGLLALAFACSSSTAAKSDKLCTPGAYVFCRCQDKSEGAKLCKEDGVSYEPCEPCESLGLGEDPDPGEPPTDFDGGVPARCGDGVVQEGEDCDDKNTDETDGCTKDCKLSAIAPSNGAGARSFNCPGLTVHVWGDDHKPSTTGTTLGSGNHGMTPNCTGQAGGATTGAAAPDRVFRVTAHKTGQMIVRTSDADYNSVLYVSETCPLPDAGVGTDIQWSTCMNGATGTGGETMTFPVDADKSYYVFVDGVGIDDLKDGNFRVTFEIP